MKYTLTVWIDFVDDSPEAAAETGEDIEMAVRGALHLAYVTKIETELAAAEKQEPAPEATERIAREDARWAYLDKRQLP